MAALAGTHGSRRLFGGGLCFLMRLCFTRVLKLFKDSDHSIHRWPHFSFVGQAFKSKGGNCLCTVERVLTFQPGIQDPEYLALMCQVRSSPFNEIVLPLWTVFVDGTAA